MHFRQNRNRNSDSFASGRVVFFSPSGLPLTQTGFILNAMKTGLLIIGLIVSFALPVEAWNATGHMTVAFIAYQRLTPGARARVDKLLKLNPEYPHWIAGAAAGQEGLAAFMNASVWPDCIKGSQCPGYTADGANGGNDPPKDPTATLNIGYADRLMHKYWHFIDHPYSPFGLPSEPAPPVNAVTEIRIMRAAIGSTAGDDVKSYDIAWLSHLIGDLHQPLHAIARFTTRHPSGDAGGNLVRFCAAPCEFPDNLHAYWDGLIGGDPPELGTVKSIATGLMAQPKPRDSSKTGVMEWSRDSAALAVKYSYAPPIDGDNNPQVTFSPRPSAAYDKNARDLARRQVLLAGYRLANLLNKNLK